MTLLANLIFEHTAPATAILVALGAVALLSLFAFWRYFPKSWAGWAILGIRLLFLALLGWCLFLPAHQDDFVERLQQRFVILVDRSASMELSPSEDVPSRWTNAREFLREPWVRNVQREFRVDPFLFGREVEGVNRIEDLRTARPDAGGTHLRDALRNLGERYRGQDVAGILVLTDGLDTRETDDSWAVGPWGIPLHIVHLEDEADWEEEPDVRVESILAQRRVMVGWETSVTAVISGQGVGPDPVPVRLYRDGELIREVPTQVPTGGGRREVPFTISNPEVGTFTYTVEIPPLPGESNVDDNAYSVSIQVIEAENRMLYVEGVPRWESRYLSRVLRANPDLEPTILMYLGGQFRSMGLTDEVSLELTEEDLAPFSVVILGDFSAENLGPERAGSLVRFVEEGGSLILLGGSSSWGEDGLLQTPLQPLIPFRRAITRAPSEARYRTFLTPEGRQHPAFTQGEDLLDWSNLPPVLSVFPVRQLSPGATALAEVEAEGRRYPLLAVQRYGDGRVLSVLTDSLWRWQLEPRDDRPFLRFWNQILNWMGPSEDDRETETFDLFADADQLYLGETINLTARVPDRLREEIDQASVRLEMELPERRRVSLSMLEQTVTTPTGMTFPGFGVEFTATEPGLHRAVARAVRADGRIESEPYTFFVRAFTAETEPRPANRELLEVLASSSGGSFGTMAEQAALLRELRGQDREETRFDQRTLWNLWLVLGCLVGLLTLEWIIRKARNHV